MNSWVNDCEKNLNAIVFDNVTAKILQFSAMKTINIPPMADYTRKKRPFRGSSESLDSCDSALRSAVNGFEAECIVQNCFGKFGPGGVYLSNLSILSLVSGNKSSHLLPFLPDGRSVVHDFLKKNASDIEIDGLFIHPKMGLAVIEIKAVAFSDESDSNNRRLPMQLDKAKNQLERTERFINGFYYKIFEKPMHIPVYKVACAPNSITEKRIARDVDLLDRSSLSADGTCGLRFTEFWNRKMMFAEQDAENTQFKKFAAVLISLKTAFGLVSEFMSDIMTKTHGMINRQESVIDDNKHASHGKAANLQRIQPVKMLQDNKPAFFWLNKEQLVILNADPGRHFLDGVPGSGKTLLLKARVLKFISNRNRFAAIFCPTALTHQYQLFVNDNGLKDKVQVKNFADLCKISILFNNNSESFYNSKHAYFLSDKVDIYCDEMDFNTIVKPNLCLLLNKRPSQNADTFVVGESPELAKNAIHEIFKVAASGFSRRCLKTMMRNSKEIMTYYKNEFDWDILLGHTISTCVVVPPIQCQNRRMVLSEVVKNVRFLLKKGYKPGDLAVISIGGQKRDMEYALRLSKISTTNLANSSNSSDSVTVVNSADVKSYEWKAVIISVDYDHERQLPLAITRATTEFVIVQDTAYSRTIEELKTGDCKSPEEILWKHAFPGKVDDLDIYCRAFPNVKHKAHMPTKHCENRDEYRNWSIYGKLQECGYSPKDLLNLCDRVKFEQDKKLEEQISRRIEFTKLPKNERAFKSGTLLRSKQLSGSIYSLQSPEFYSNSAFDGESAEKNSGVRSSSNWQLSEQQTFSLLPKISKRKNTSSNQNRLFNTPTGAQNLRENLVDEKAATSKRKTVIKSPRILTIFPMEKSEAHIEKRSHHKGPEERRRLNNSPSHILRLPSPAPALKEEKEHDEAVWPDDNDNDIFTNYNGKSAHGNRESLNINTSSAPSTSNNSDLHVTVQMQNGNERKNMEPIKGGPSLNMQTIHGSFYPHQNEDEDILEIRSSILTWQTKLSARRLTMQSQDNQNYINDEVPTAVYSIKNSSKSSSQHSLAEKQPEKKKSPNISHLTKEHSTSTHSLQTKVGGLYDPEKRLTVVPSSAASKNRERSSSTKSHIAQPIVGVGSDSLVHSIKNRPLSTHSPKLNAHSVATATTTAIVKAPFVKAHASSKKAQLVLPETDMDFFDKYKPVEKNGKSTAIENNLLVPFRISNNNTESNAIKEDIHITSKEARHSMDLYQQGNFPDTEKRGKFKLVVSGDGRDGSMMIHRNVKIFAGLFDGNEHAEYELSPGRKLRIQVAKGSVHFNDLQLNEGDAIGVEEAGILKIDKGSKSEISLFDLN